MIPKIIHQTWRSDTLPSIFQSILDENKKVNGGFEFKLWSHSPGKPDIDNLIKEKYPDVYEIFIKAKYGVQKADIGRLALLHHYGGIYFDLDMLCLKGLADLFDFDSNSVFMAMEPNEQTERIFNKSNMVCNAFLATPPNHPLMTAALSKIDIIYKKHGDNIFNTFNVFGADLLASCMVDNSVYNECKFIKRSLVYPINDPKFTDLNSSEKEASMLKNGSYGSDTYMVHYWIHSDFESKDLLDKFECDKSRDIHFNVLQFFKQVYPDNKHIRN